MAVPRIETSNRCPDHTGTILTKGSGRELSSLCRCQSDVWMMYLFRQFNVLAAVGRCVWTDAEIGPGIVMGVGVVDASEEGWKIDHDEKLSTLLSRLITSNRVKLITSDF